ncbi:hypothetical protein M513_08964 [Trichuris suis]|uniref:Uncharacterized protein n=1 Tax=Trichuris suis TaxID=68888 RepID=A0A085LYS9_9BILA|nr:hypothetical protein M513_08964 [Trichuris suis]
MSSKFLRAVRTRLDLSLQNGWIDRRVSVFYGINSFDEEEECPPTFLRAVRTRLELSLQNGWIDRRMQSKMKNTYCSAELLNYKMTAEEELKRKQREHFDFDE